MTDDAMATTCSQPTKHVDAETGAYAQELRRRLRESLGTDFDLWVGPAPWRSLDGAGQVVVGGALAPRARRVAGLLDEQLNGNGDPLVLDSAGNDYLLVIPFGRCHRAPLAATARFARPPGGLTHWSDTFPWPQLHDTESACATVPAAPCCDPELLVRMARVVVQNVLLERQCERSRLERDRYVEQISQSYEEITLWHQVTKCLEGDRDQWHAADAVLPWLKQLIHAETLVLVESRADAGSGEEAAPVRVGSPKLWLGRRDVAEDVCCRLVRRHRAQAALEPLVKNHVDTTRTGRQLPGVRSFVLLPLARGGAAFGWLVALNRAAGEEFGTAEASLMHSTAAILAAHGHNAELFREKEALLVGVVRALVSAIDAKDPSTRGHSERVGLIAGRLGRELGLAERTCEQLYLTGMLHDIGKIGVADRVLCKRGTLSAAEFDEIKRHVEVGYAILKDLPHVSYALPGVRHHHERYNGKGYPDGLAGEDIPLFARIVAVADAFDAMSSHRPYREAVAPLQVEDVLLHGANQQWDARVVEAFFGVLPEIRALRESQVPEGEGTARFPQPGRDEAHKARR